MSSIENDTDSELYCIASSPSSSSSNSNSFSQSSSSSTSKHSSYVSSNLISSKLSSSDSDDEIPILLHSNLDYGTVINKSTIHDKYRGQYFYTDTIRYRYQTLEVSPEVYKSYCRTNKVSPLHCLRTFIAYPLNQYEKCVLMNYYKYNHTLKSQIQWLEDNNALENFTERELMSVLSLRRDLF